MQKSRDLVVACYLRLLALVYFCAFASLLPQLEGLYSNRGIAPVEGFLSAVSGSFFSCPTLLYFAPHYEMLVVLAIAGCLLAVMLFFAILEPLVLFSLYFAYLSIVSIGQEFLSFQWDMLLLESGFISIFLGRSKYFSFSQRSAKFALIALAWLTFRLMFSSGFVKLFSEPTTDSSWLSLTALSYHFETQPLPTPLALLCQQLPLQLSKAACALTLIIEVLVPFFIFTRRRLRLVAALLFIFLQLAIALTGNYGFFNLLTIALTLSLVEEQDLEKAFAKAHLLWLCSWLRRLAPGVKDHQQKIFLLLEGMLAGSAAILVIFASCLSLALTMAGREFFDQLPQPVRLTYGLCQSWGISAGYGLFASMTRERPELVIEGSLDGKIFLPYEFIYKVGALDRPPPVVAPYMPRLDWQMWFEALSATSGAKPSRWFVRFLTALAGNEPGVSKLIATNPFINAQKPPKYIRVRIFNYKMETLPLLLESGHWWKRQEKGLYVSGHL